MSFATTIGHGFTGVLGHHPRLHRRTAAPTTASTKSPAPEEHRRIRSTPVDRAVAEHREELEQWRTAFTLAIGLQR
jgi:hypothetical protein